jgi:hypothetical protein
VKANKIRRAEAKKKKKKKVKRVESEQMTESESM